MILEGGETNTQRSRQVVPDPALEHNCVSVSCIRVFISGWLVVIPLSTIGMEDIGDIGIGSVWGIWGISVSVRYGGYGEYG